MKSKPNTTIVVNDGYGDSHVYRIDEMDTHQIAEVFIRILRHLHYMDESIERGLHEVEVIDNY